MCSQNTGKIAKKHTFIISITEKPLDLASDFDEIACNQNFIDEINWVLKYFKRKIKKHKELNFQCKPCTSL